MTTAEETRAERRRAGNGVTTTGGPNIGQPVPRTAGDASQRLRVLGYALLAALSYIPLLLTDPGKISADTKQYLYLDPARMLGRAVSMWDPNIGLGTVTHQNIGYVFPMAPYYWLFRTIDVPVWVAQRLWLGTILFAAGLGVLYLMRTLGVKGPGVPVAALAFMLSPYSLDYAARISAILLPWAALPWMIALVVRALRERGWRYPAWFAITVTIVGGVNATSLIYAGLGPVLWIFCAVWVNHEVSFRRAAATVGRIGLLTVVTSLWWISGLRTQAGYGLDVLKFTETIETVAKTSLAPETLRGLGYWFFYGQDKLGPWIQAGSDYTQHLWLILVGYGLAALALLAAASIRWRYRVFFVLMLLVGTTIAVGAYPYDNPSPLGALFKRVAEGSTAGLAMRSTARAVPLVVLATAVLLGMGVNALAGRWQAPKLRSRGVLVAGLVGVLVLVNMPSIFTGSWYGPNLERPESIPQYWKDAIKYLDAQPHNTRILELPGADFSSYLWGNTVDPITPGLTNRPYVARELIPYGSPASADLLIALDRRLQENVLDVNAIAPVSRLMSVGDVVLRNDLEVDRYNLARPRVVKQEFTPTPAGLDPPVDFGSKLPGHTFYPLLDEIALAAPPTLTDPAPVQAFGVSKTIPIVRTNSAAAPIVLSADGEGVVEAAASGAIDGSQLLLYSGSFTTPAELRKAVVPGSTLIVTDSNRKRARRWSTVRDNLGFTEQANQTTLAFDPNDARLDVFPGASTKAQTVVEQRGVKSVVATRYGNPVSYTPEDRPARAMDGDLTTAWKVGAFDNVKGERILVELQKSITTDRINLVQPQKGPRDRWITQATLHFEDAAGKAVGSDVPITLGQASRVPAGETVTFPSRTFASVSLKIDGTNRGQLDDYKGVSAVGFAEMRMHDGGAQSQAPDVKVDEVVRMPTDLTAAEGAASLQHPLVYLMERLRTTPVPPRYDEELLLARSFGVPAARAFALTGEARIEDTAPDSTVDTVLGYPDAAHGGVTATSSEHLPGDVQARASSAIDGDPSTAWQTPFAGILNQWIQFKSATPVTFDHLDLQLLADGRHSVPTRIRVEAGGQTRVVTLPAVTDQTTPNAVAKVTTPTFEPLTGDTVRVTIDAMRPVQTVEYYSTYPIVMPAGIAELGIPGLARGTAPAQLSGACRTDLLKVDGKPVPVSITGTLADAEVRNALKVTPCGSAAAGIQLGKGDHLLRSVVGRSTAIDLDALSLSSARGGAAGVTPTPGAEPAKGGSSGPKVTVTHDGRTGKTVKITGATKPFWLVLGQSRNTGWVASGGSGAHVGKPTLVDGYANGWLVTPKASGGTITVHLDWTPQRFVWASLILSALGVAVCLALVVVLGLRRRRRPAELEASTVTPAPRFVSPFGGRSRTNGIAINTFVPVIALFVGGILMNPAVGVLMGVVAVLVLRFGRLRPLLTLGAPAALMLAGLYIAAQQYRHNFTARFEWPTLFSRIHVLGWIAVLFVALDVLIDVLRERQRERQRSAPPRRGRTPVKPIDDISV
ncbi:MAG: type protein [Actinomycetia bacterium]|nr:type protein [Actinomycetes bacterium]